MVNRLLTEGRRAVLRRVSGIQRGTECARYEPLLSALADGEATAEDLAKLRPHMQTYLSCRAALREFRAAPARVAALVPPAALAATDAGGPLRSLLETVLGAAQQKSAALGERIHTAAELATGQKLAAVAASAAALAGGGTAVDQFANHQGPPQPRPEHVEAAAVKDEAPAQPAPQPAPTVEQEPVAPAPAPAPEPEPPPQPPPPDPANEFAPAGGAPAAAASPTPSPAPAEPAGDRFTSGGGGASGGRGAGEFAP
jgi:outer membrane biosynthesis protein TonB